MRTPVAPSERQWRVTFWPNHVRLVWMPEDEIDPEMILEQALAESLGGWPGSSEVTDEGIHFQVWVSRTQRKRAAK